MSSGDDLLKFAPLALPLAPIALPALLGAGATAGIAGAAAVPGLSAAASFGAAAGGGGGFIASLTTAELLGAGLSAASGLSTMATGFQEESASKVAASNAEFNARQATLDGRAQAIDALTRANKFNARRSVVDNARGIEFQGTPETSQGKDVQGQRLDQELARLGGASRSLASELEASGLHRQGKQSRNAGIVGGLTNIGQGAIRLNKR